MRLPLAAMGLLMLTASLAGCFERNGTLTLDLAVASTPALNEFTRANFSLESITIAAKTLDPARLPSELGRIELVSAARSGDSFRLFQGQVRADRYDRITLHTPPGATFQGTLRDGTTVAVVVPGNTLAQTSSFEMPRGGAVTYVFTIAVQKNDPGQGTPTYFVAPVDEDSGPR
jgi:hypothetical protein